MGIDAFGDAGVSRDLAHHLPDPLAGVRARATTDLLPAEEQRSRAPVADVHGEQAGEFGAEWDLAAFAALAALDGDRALPEADILDAQGHEFGDPSAGFEQGLHHQAGSAVAGIGGVDEPELFLERQPGGRVARFLRRVQSGLDARRPEDRLGLDVVDAFAEQDVGDLVGDASDVAVHGFAFRVSENKLADVLPRSGRENPRAGVVRMAQAFLSANSGKLVRGRDMKIEIRLRIDVGDDGPGDEEILVLDKPHDQLEKVGLSLAEAKELLGRVQDRVVGAQAAAFVADHRHCDACGRRLWSKGQTSLQFRTPFGDVPVTGPRLKSCRCQSPTRGSFSPLTGLFTEHVAPEMLYLETKWASLVPFGVTVELLRDVLPVGTTLNAQTVCNHLRRVATRMEESLGEERTSWVEDCPPDRARLPLPEGPVVVGIDGGYVRAREPGRVRREANFEVVVGQSIAEDRDNRYFGLVQSFDDRPKRRLHEVLREQGLQMNQDITFLTDGGDTVRNLASDMSPCAEHVLDWFHLTMRLTVLGQYAKGLAHHDDEEAHAIERELKRIKGYLWNGNHREALACIDGLANDLEDLEDVPTTYPGIKAFRKGVDEFHTYVRRNAHTIPNYAERHRYGEGVSTAFAESTVNAVVGKRFAKRQQMRWSKRGAHLMLQTRTRVLDDTLRVKFQSWYPGLFHVRTPALSEHDLAA